MPRDPNRFPLPYAAYGSNMSHEQMQRRCPGAEYLGPAVIDGWELYFDRVASIRPAEKALVPVSMWKVTREHMETLDSFEGYPTVYRREIIEVSAIDSVGARKGPFRSGWAAVYVMIRSRGWRAPSVDYVRTIEKGYREAGFDPGFLRTAVDESVRESRFVAATKTYGWQR